MKTSTRMFLGIGLGILSAVLLIFAFQPYSIWPLALVAFVPMLIAGRRILPLRWSGLGSGVGIGGWLIVFLISLFGMNQVALIFLGVAVLISLISVFSEPKVRAFHERTLAGAGGGIRPLMRRAVRDRRSLRGVRHAGLRMNPPHVLTFPPWQGPPCLHHQPSGAHG